MLKKYVHIKKQVINYRDFTKPQNIFLRFCTIDAKNISPFKSSNYNIELINKQFLL